MSYHNQVVLDAALRNDFPSFVHRGVLALNPGRPFMPNWHIDAIAYALERVRRGEITRLIINLPPRHLKSTLVSSLFPAFWLGHQPDRRIITLSYGADLSEKHASDFRSIVESAWYRRAFPRMQIRRAANADIYTSRHGYRLATSVFGPLTGLGGDCFIIDDPQKAVDAQSATHREHLHQWYTNTLLSRLDNKQTGVIIIVMQRVHMDDLTGYVTTLSDDWTVLSLPAIAEVDEAIPIGEGQVYHRRAGEALHPAYEPLETLQRLRREIGSYDFAAQYQQSPVPPGGAMIKREWLRYYTEPPARNYDTKILISLDAASKEGVNNDYSVFTIWAVKDNDYYLLDLVRNRYDYPRLRDMALMLAARHKPRNFLIEDASVGTALAQDLRRHHVVGVKLVRPEGDKTSRLYVQQAKFEAGRVHFRQEAPWLPELEAELLAFPHGKHDDQVDSICQALAYTSKYKGDTSMRWVSDRFQH